MKMVFIYEESYNATIKRLNELQSKLDQVAALLAPKSDADLAEKELVVCDCDECKDDLAFTRSACPICGAVGQWAIIACDCSGQCDGSCAHGDLVCRVCLSEDYNVTRMIGKIRAILIEQSNDQPA